MRQNLFGVTVFDTDGSLSLRRAGLPFTKGLLIDLMPQFLTSLSGPMSLFPSGRFQAV